MSLRLGRFPRSMHMSRQNCPGVCTARRSYIFGCLLLLQHQKKQAGCGKAKKASHLIYDDSHAQVFRSKECLNHG